MCRRVIGMTDLLLMTELDDDQADYARTVRESASSLMVILTDILDFARLEKGAMTLTAAPFDFEELIHEVAQLMSAQVLAKGLRLDVLYQPDVPRRFIGDAARIRQILTNLVGNAVKFTPQGRVQVRVSCLDPGAEPLCMCLAVEDTGIGIPAEMTEAIFERFTQVDGSTSRHFGGTGLGLTIVKRLVEMMNGSVGVSSRLGEGSTFRVSLPLTIDARSATQLSTERRESVLC